MKERYYEASKMPFGIGDKIAKCFAANNNNNRSIQYAISVIICIVGEYRFMRIFEEREKKTIHFVL